MDYVLVMCIYLCLFAKHLHVEKALQFCYSLRCILVSVEHLSMESLRFNLDLYS